MNWSCDFAYDNSSFTFVLQDHEILKTWLRDLRYEEYFVLFIQAGYDMRTISRMTPEVWPKLAVALIVLYYVLSQS